VVESYSFTCLGFSPLAGIKFVASGKFWELLTLDKMFQSPCGDLVRGKQAALSPTLTLMGRSFSPLAGIRCVARWRWRGLLCRQIINVSVPLRGLGVWQVIIIPVLVL